jgi:hypothetical protein
MFKNAKIILRGRFFNFRAKSKRKRRSGSKKESNFASINLEKGKKMVKRLLKQKPKVVSNKNIFKQRKYVKNLLKSRRYPIKFISAQKLKLNKMERRKRVLSSPELIKQQNFLISQWFKDTRKPRSRRSNKRVLKKTTIIRSKARKLFRAILADRALPQRSRFFRFNVRKPQFFFKKNVLVKYTFLFFFINF